MDISDLERDNLHELFRDFATEPPSLETINRHTQIRAIEIKMRNTLEHLKENGPTAALWVQYFQIVTLLKEYICAERSGDWNEHLRCVHQMIPIFHASGHFLYAKACHLYMQDMLCLKSKMSTEEYDKFVKEGYFTVRRTDKFWSGVWSDMTIEQTLMRSMKSTGGLTHGRGITDSVLSKWILGTTATHGICESFEDFSGQEFVSSDQHVDLQQSRKARDIQKLVDWFENHPPLQKNDKIMSIASGVIGDTSINCYNAIDVGKKAVTKIVGNNFSDVMFSRKDKVFLIASINSTVKIVGFNTVVNPLLLFQRIAIAKQTDEDLATYLQYELAPFPLALFNEAGMRKTTKSALYDVFEVSNKDLNLLNCINIVDGGFLLHRVKWGTQLTFSAVCTNYINYIKKHYGTNCIVIFDGYSNTTNSTKKCEQNRRSVVKKSVDINFDGSMRVTVQQEQFLSNENNKSKLISMLSAELENNGILFRQSNDDADILIVNTAINEACSGNNNVVIIGEDVDLLVLLTALAPTEKDIFLVKPGKGKAEKKIYSSNQLQSSGLTNSILFLHAFSGCDTTSAAFSKGKKKCVKMFQSKDMEDNVTAFNKCNSSHNDVAQAGERFFLIWYGAQPSEQSLNKFRYKCFAKSVTKIKPDILSLPPTEGAARQHSFRVYHQVQKWLGNELNPEVWGWKRQEKTLVPITTMDAAAPDSVLNMVFCNCKTDCGVRCGCRKAGINCTI